MASIEVTPDNFTDNILIPGYLMKDDMDNSIWLLSWSTKLKVRGVV